MRYINETYTKGGSLKKVTCWFDKRRYKTNKEKIASGESVLTRAELDEMAEGRITYPFADENSDMSKWNYVITPKAV